MTRVFRVFLALAAILLIAPNARGASLVVRGVVVNETTGVPLGGVSVAGEYGNYSGSSVTNSEGQFEIRFSYGSPPKLREVAIILKKSGYGEKTKIMQLEQAELRDLRFSMTQTLGAAALGPEDKSRLGNEVSSDGRTLFLLPYSGDGGPDAASAISLNRLAEAVHRFVTADFQELAKNASSFPPALKAPFSIRLLPKETTVLSDAERLTSIGRYLNALALAGGSKAVVRQGGTDKLLMESKFLIIPQTAGFDAYYLQIDDIVPMRQINTLKFHEGLSDYWALYILLAFSIKEMRDTETSPDRRMRLEQIRSCLKAKKAQYGPADKRKVASIDTLLKSVEAKLRQTGVR